MKIREISFVLMLMAALVPGACSDDDSGGPGPGLSEVDLLFFEEGGIVTVPEAMASSGDTHAAVASAYVYQFNVVSIYGAFFNVPEGATTSDPVTAPNSRVSANTTTYVYSYDGNEIAYQITDQGDSYYFELFMKLQGESYYKYMDGEQKKDGSEATLHILDTSVDERVVLLSYYVVRTSNGYTLKMTDNEENYVVDIESNNDLSGSIVVNEDGAVTAEYEWDAAGNGSWKEYGSEGNLLDQGSWTI